jgi:Predicted multitransmembrane protein
MIKIDKHFILKKCLPIALSIFILGALALFANAGGVPKINGRGNVSYDKATVLNVVSEKLEPDPVTGKPIGFQTIEIKIESGKQKGKVVTVENSVTRQNTVLSKQGTRLLINVSDGGGVAVYGVYTYNRTIGVIIFVLIFCAILIAIGGKKGAKALVGLLVTIFCILCVFIPLLFKGVPPIVASMLLVGVCSVLIMSIIDGLNSKTISAIVATIACSLTAGLFSIIGGALLNITDFHLSDTDSLLTLMSKTDFNANGIFFASVLIASMGAIIDTAISITSALHEIVDKKPGITRKELMKSGMNIGRDAMGTMSNTLILAFVGGYLTYLVTLYTYDVSLTEVFSFASVGEELISGLSGSIGIFFAVPLSAFIASRMMVKTK